MDSALLRRQLAKLSLNGLSIGDALGTMLDWQPEQAGLNAEVTHWHIEGKAGAIAVAASFAAAWFENGTLEQNEGRLIESVLPFLPKSVTGDMILQSRQLDSATPVDQVASMLGCGKNVLSQDTVPFCLWSAQKNLRDYAEAIWTTASVFGDIDTNCAIVGSIVSLVVGKRGIPEDWLLSSEPLNG